MSKRIPKDKGLYNTEIIDKLKPVASELNLPEEYIHDSMGYEHWEPAEHPIFSPPTIKNPSFKRILNRALLLQGIDKTARELKIDPRYIHITSKEIDKKGAHNKIINRGLELQEKENGKDGGLTSRLGLLIAATTGLLTGLFFLSSNLTGNVVNNMPSSTSNIIGIGLFVGGLIFLFFWLKNKLVLFN